MDLKVDHIFLTSTGAGQAGLLLGSSFLEADYKVTGIACGRPGDRFNVIRDLANDTAKLLGLDMKFEL